MIELKKGSLTIESDADGVPVRIVQGDRIKELTVSREGKSCRIAAGEYTIELGDGVENMTVDESTVSIRPAEKQSSEFCEMNVSHRKRRQRTQMCRQKLIG